MYLQIKTKDILQPNRLSSTTLVEIQAFLRCLLRTSEHLKSKQSLHTICITMNRMQYTVILHGCKNDNFQKKNCEIVAQNIDCVNR